MSGHQTILLADTDATYRAKLRSFLIRGGFEVVEASEAQEVRTWLRSVKLQAIILSEDLASQANENIHELCAGARAMQPAIECIVVTNREGSSVGHITGRVFQRSSEFCDLLKGLISSAHKRREPMKIADKLWDFSARDMTRKRGLEDGR